MFSKNPLHLVFALQFFLLQSLDLEMKLRSLGSLFHQILYFALEFHVFLTEVLEFLVLREEFFNKFFILFHGFPSGKNIEDYRVILNLLSRV